MNNIVIDKNTNNDNKDIFDLKNSSNFPMW